jgi:hypothetical protein
MKSWAVKLNALCPGGTARWSSNTASLHVECLRGLFRQMSPMQFCSTTLSAIAGVSAFLAPRFLQPLFFSERFESLHP